MGKKLLIFLILIGLGFISFTKYNQMANMEKGLREQWGVIESQYALKSDIVQKLSKNVADNVEGDFTIYTELDQARNEAAMVTVDTDNFTAEALAPYLSAYSKIIAIQKELLEIADQSEEATDNQEFREIVTELEGNEIRISNERRRLNEQVELYNKYINNFFNLAIAQVFGFKDWPLIAPILGE